jgi:hypothetical protein
MCANNYGFLFEKKNLPKSRAGRVADIAAASKTEHSKDAASWPAMLLFKFFKEASADSGSLKPSSSRTNCIASNSGPARTTTYEGFGRTSEYGKVRLRTFGKTG